MGFKKLRGVALPEKKQGLVRFVCLNYDDQPKRTQEKIQRLCDECGGAYSAALFEVMTTEKSIRAIALTNFLDESTIYRARARFYMAWYGKAKPPPKGDGH